MGPYQILEFIYTCISK